MPSALPTWRPNRSRSHKPRRPHLTTPASPSTMQPAQGCQGVGRGHPPPPSSRSNRIETSLETQLRRAPTTTYRGQNPYPYPATALWGVGQFLIDKRLFTPQPLTTRRCTLGKGDLVPCVISTYTRYMFICRICKTHFDVEKRRGRSPVFCSPECRVINREMKYPRKTNKITTCQICGTTFENLGPGAAAKVCSRKCKSEKERLRSLAMRPTYFRNCEICNVAFETRNKKSLACSSQCQTKRVQIYYKTKWLDEKAKRPQVKTWVCKWCNTSMDVPISYSGIRAYHDACRIQARRHKDRVKNVRRQNAQVEPKRLDIEMIAARDLFICHICETNVDMSLPRTSRMGATLDHVFPLSLGGDDSLENVKLAHWICNVKKSNKVRSQNG
jgi:hypothetical protein